MLKEELRSGTAKVSGKKVDRNFIFIFFYLIYLAESYSIYTGVYIYIQ